MTDRAKPRQVDASECEEYAQKIGAAYFECSAKTGFNVPEIFDYIGTQYAMLHADRFADAAPAGGAPGAASGASGDGGTIELASGSGRGDGASGKKGPCRC